MMMAAVSHKMAKMTKKSEFLEMFFSGWSYVGACIWGSECIRLLGMIWV